METSCYPEDHHKYMKGLATMHQQYLAKVLQKPCCDLMVLYLSRILQAPCWDPQDVCEGTCETKDNAHAPVHSNKVTSQLQLFQAYSLFLDRFQNQ